MNKDIILNKMHIGNEFKKSIYNPRSEFMRQLELEKLKLEIKPRKHDLMKAQNAWLDDLGYTNDVINRMIKKGELR